MNISEGIGYLVLLDITAGSQSDNLAFMQRLGYFSRWRHNQQGVTCSIQLFLGILTIILRIELRGTKTNTWVRGGVL
jgi:hypothetical protein